MPTKNLAKTIDIQPLSGTMFARSTPDLVPFGAWRYLQNAELRGPRDIYRSTGWEKLLSRPLYENEDLRDQLIDIASIGSLKEPVTFLFEAISSSGFSRLIAGTPRRLYALNNSTGNWKIISDELGTTLAGTCDDFGWTAGQVGEHVIFSNGVDDLVYWVFDQHVVPGSTQSVKRIPDLTTIGVSSAKIVISLNGVIALMNVVQDGFRAPMRVVISDINRPLSYRPNEGTSVANQFDLSGTGEYIIAAAPLGNSVYIYTNVGIWEMTISGDLDAFADFKRKYYAKDNANRCLAYRRTLVSTGVEHYYMGRDGIYRYSPYTPEPERLEWIREGAAVIYGDLNRTICNGHVGAYNSDKKTILFSWAPPGTLCPTKTLAVNTEYEHCHVIDHGFTAFAHYHPDNPKTIRQWLLENCICTPQGLIDAGFGSTKEREVNCRQEVVPVCDSYPVNIYSDQTLLVDGVAVEDYTQASASAGSLCDRLAGITAQDLCDAELTSDECQSEQLFIGVSGSDQGIKQFTEVYYRERITGFGLCGVYELDGYVSIMRSGAMDFKSPQLAKVLSWVDIEAFAEETTSPLEIFLRVGASHQAADPSLDRCALMWRPKESRLLKCATNLTAAQLLAKGLRPAKGIEWPVYVEGNFIFYEFSISGKGGASHFSRIGLMVRGKNNRY